MAVTPLYDLIKTLTEIPGPTGQEDRVHEWCANHWSQFAEHVEITQVGNVVARIGGEGPALIVLAHGDELGLMVKSITEEGFLHIWPAGPDRRGKPAHWYNPVNSPVLVLADNGDVDGQLVFASGHVIGGASDKQHFEWNDWFVDLGYSSRADVEALGIHPGTRVVVNVPTRRLGDTIIGKAMDDRAPLAVATALAERVDTTKIKYQLWVGSTIQEENGLLGAASIPDVHPFSYAFALDVGLCGEVPGTQAINHPAKLRHGPIVVYQDSSANYSARMCRATVEAARSRGIPVQQAVFQNYGSDGAELIRRGIETVLLTMPTRYTHSPNEMVTEADCDACVDLLIAFLESEPLGPRWTPPTN
ncbi:MAG TPA: M20/M25/M40 family metallo-hydrolase [Thermomicrobiales bacterium]|nr:M20/M25/M40 family metallo-hydrolase [Thermomicrobiales bacterium]